LAGLLIAFSFFVVPKWNTTRTAGRAIGDANEKLNSGDMTGGLAELQHALNVLRSAGAPPPALLDSVKNRALSAAVSLPLQSDIALRFLDDNGYAVPCEQRLAMYDTLLKSGVEAAKNGKLKETGAFLYLAPLWGGQCGIDPDNITLFRKLFDYYKKKQGAAFAQAAWMAPAYQGKPIAPPPPPPPTPGLVVSPEGAKTKTGLIDSIKSMLGLTKMKQPEKPAAATGTVSLPQTPALPEKTPEPSKIKETLPAHEASNLVTTPPAKPAPAAPATVTEQNPAANPPQASQTAQKSVQAFFPAPKKIAKPAEPVKKESPSILKRITSAPSALMSRFFGKAKKKETPAVKESPAPVVDASVIAKEVSSATGDLHGMLPVFEVKAPDVSFSKDGTIVYIVFVSKNIGNPKLVGELKTIFSAIEERVKQTGILPLSEMRIQLFDEKNTPRAKWIIKYGDYLLYRAKKIDGTTFRSRWIEIIP